MLHFETIEPATLELLRSIQAIPELEQTRLVGGTSLALQLGHRKSVDLDFFGSVPYDTNTLVAMLKPLGEVTVLKDSTNIHILLINGIKVDFVNFDFPWRQEALIIEGLRLAQLEDIAAMKITAVVGRGTKKDFIDVANLLKIYSLAQIFSFYESKYPNASAFMAMKSLLYFEDAEHDAMPVMLIPQSWEEAKTVVTEAVNGM